MKKAKAVITKDSHHSELVAKLAKLAYENSIFYPPHVAEFIREGNPTILKMLKRHKIKPEECTGSVLRLAHEKYDSDWKQSIRDWNTTHPEMPTVLIGDPEFDPSVHIALETPKEPLQPEISELETPEIEKVAVSAPETPLQPVLQQQTPNPWEIPVEALDLPEPPAKKKPAPLPAVEKKAKTNRGATYLGYSLSGVLRWLADHDRKKKVDREESLDRLRRFVIKLEMALSHHTVKCQHTAGWLGKNHYGEMPDIAKKDQKTIFAMLDNI